MYNKYWNVKFECIINIISWKAANKDLLSWFYREEANEKSDKAYRYDREVLLNELREEFLVYFIVFCPSNKRLFLFRLAVFVKN